MHSALVGVELKHKEDYEQLITRFKENNIQFMELNKTLFCLICLFNRREE